MSELTITLLRLGYLAALWLFVLVAISVLRRDIYGTRVSTRATEHRTRRPTTSARSAESSEPRPRQTEARPTRLVVTEGNLAGTTIPLTESAILIGRAAACTLVLDDDYASSRHARIFPQGDHWVVEDLGSTNGTFIGPERLAEPQILPVGTAVRIGQSFLELQR
ncbi:FHA domain-containing protein FhaB/FipA [Sanguibacter sp. A247]|uniref:FHA domain-containing protein FhaB/FipA n=1 Tax=unclassified Sanguibacter TaxID=2645534 RepID=UPI003FD8172B